MLQCPEASGHKLEMNKDFQFPNSDDLIHLSSRGCETAGFKVGGMYKKS